jgi:hypothetical protein
MTLKKYYLKVFWEISMACGAMLVAMTIYMQLTGRESVFRESLWRIVLLGSTIVLRGESLINFHDLSDRNMRINYLISSVLSDATLIVFLYWFTPGGQFFVGKGWIIIGVFVFFKGLFYLMNYIQSLQNAKEINARLSMLNNKS